MTELWSLRRPLVLPCYVLKCLMPKRRPIFAALGYNHGRRKTYRCLDIHSAAESLASPICALHYKSGNVGRQVICPNNDASSVNKIYRVCRRRRGVKVISEIPLHPTLVNSSRVHQRRIKGALKCDLVVSGRLRWIRRQYVRSSWRAKLARCDNQIKNQKPTAMN